MAEFKAVTISKGSFAFCRYTIAILLWSSILFQMKELVIACFLLLTLSYILKVQKAPLVVLYDVTIEKIMPSDKELVDEKGIRFAHLVGAVFSGIGCLLLYFVNPIAGWIFTALLAILKSSAAFGFCSALKLYSCMTGGNCCRVGRLMRRNKHV